MVRCASRARRAAARTTQASQQHRPKVRRILSRRRRLPSGESPLESVKEGDWERESWTKEGESETLGGGKQRGAAAVPATAERVPAYKSQRSESGRGKKELSCTAHTHTGECGLAQLCWFSCSPHSLALSRSLSLAIAATAARRTSNGRM